MIYIIDDSKLESYNAVYLLEEVKKGAGRIKLIRTMSEFNMIAEEIKSAECIMCHNTFNEDVKARERIIELTNNGRQIPLVIYSDGHTYLKYDYKTNPTYIQELNKREFYRNFNSFYEHFKKNKDVEFRLLAFGEKYNYVEAHELILNIKRMLIGKKGPIPEFINDLAGAGLKKLIEMSSPVLGIKYDDLMNDIEDKKVSAGEVLTNITRIEDSFYQYGKNIYTWKREV